MQPELYKRRTRSKSWSSGLTNDALVMTSGTDPGRGRRRAQEVTELLTILGQQFMAV